MAHNPYDGLTDAMVLARAADALRAMQRLPPDSPAQVIHQSAFDAAMLELGWRAIRQIASSLDRGTDGSQAGAV